MLKKTTFDKKELIGILMECDDSFRFNVCTTCEEFKQVGGRNKVLTFSLSREAKTIYSGRERLNVKVSLK